MRAITFKIKNSPLKCEMPHFLRWSFVGNNSSQKQEKKSHDISTTDETHRGFTHKSWPARHLWTSEKTTGSASISQDFRTPKEINKDPNGIRHCKKEVLESFWPTKIHENTYSTVLSSPLRPSCSMFDIHWYSKIQQKRPKRPFVMFLYIYILFFFVCVCVLWWFAASSNTSAVEVLPNRSRLSIKSLTGTWRGMRHGQQLQLVIGLEGARMSRLATKRHSITRWSPLLQIKHCIKSRCHLSCHVIHVMNICIQLLSPKTSFKKPKLRQLKITVHSVQRCFIRVLHSGTYL